MKTSEYHEFLEEKSISMPPTGFLPIGLNPGLFDFQAAIVNWACRRGKAAIFADTGLGKTIMQAEWAVQVHRHIQDNVLIVAPLCVAMQTVKLAQEFGIEINYCRQQSDVVDGISITNYEMLHSFDCDRFPGVALDEASILKHQDSKTRQFIFDAFRDAIYKLSCTATPSPNDFMELGAQAQYLGVMSQAEMLAMFFIHDGGQTSKWRLKGHGKEKFWEWMASWAVCIRNPADLGFDGSAFELPGLDIHEHTVETSAPMEGELFIKPASTLAERRAAKRQSLDDRVQLTANLVNNSDEPFIVWCHLNDESAALAKLIPDSVEVTGSMKIEEKESRIMAFTNGAARVIVTKQSICGFGMNWQHCADMAFVGLDDSFEAFYQAIRRCYRFGQKRSVNVHLVSATTEGAVKSNLERKQAQANEMAQKMVDHMREFTEKEIKGMTVQKSEYVRDSDHGDGWDLHLADCVDLVSEMDESSIDFTIFSPPFESLYTYSNSDRDMGNSATPTEFYRHFIFLAKELFRVTKPGRLLSFHCMNLPTSKVKDGFIGVKDMRGRLVRIFEKCGFVMHSEVCIWKDPVTQMQRTKSLGLLHKQLRKDSSMSRQGLADYLVTMRKLGDNKEPIEHTHDELPVHVWQRYASPVWMDINPSRTLQYRMARENDDERHIAPLQLDVIERAVELWSNPGDLVLSPFAGIGSEGFVALQMNRRFVGSELKRSYFDAACRNLKDAKKDQGDLFSEVI